MPSNSEKLQGLIDMLYNRGIVSKEQKNKLSAKLTASYENIEFLMDMVSGIITYSTPEKAVDILMRLD